MSERFIAAAKPLDLSVSTSGQPFDLSFWSLGQNDHRRITAEVEEWPLIKNSIFHNSPYYRFRNDSFKM